MTKRCHGYFRAGDGYHGHWPRHCESSCGGQIPSVTKCGRVIAKTLGLFGGLDIVVNAATIHRFGTVLETDPDTWKQCMVMNVGSMYMYLMAHLGVPEMKKRGRGSILDIASVRGYECQRGVPAYSASKGAIYNVDGGLLPGIGVQ